MNSQNLAYVLCAQPLKYCEEFYVKRGEVKCVSVKLRCKCAVDVVAKTSRLDINILLFGF